MSDADRIKQAIGSEPVLVSGHTAGQPWGGWTNRTVVDRDGLVERLLPLLTEVRAEAWDEAVQALAWATEHGPDPLRYVAEHNPYKGGAS